MKEKKVLMNTLIDFLKW